MAYHQLALAARDMRAVHAFYEGLLGTELVKAEVAETPGGGWAKHFFYRMENDPSFVAFWELHQTAGAAPEVQTNISRAAGVPDYVNHIAFAARDGDDLERRKAVWLESGRDVMKIDHGWRRSIYTKDPNDNLVEFCVTTGAFGASDRAFALAALESDDLPRAGMKSQAVKMHAARRA